jgi:hypothetical protein
MAKWAQLHSAPMRPMTKSAPFRCLRAVALPLLAAAMLLSACGSSGEGKISPDEAAQIKNSVEQAADYYDNGKCDEADAAVAQAKSDAGNLDVDPDVKDGLDQLLSNLDDLETTCDQTEATTTSTEETTTTPSSTTTSSSDDTDTTKSTSSSTTSSSTTSTPSVTTSTTPTLSTTPPDDGGVVDGDESGGVGGTVPREAKPGKGPKHGKVPPGQAKKHEMKPKKAKQAKHEDGGVKP